MFELALVAAAVWLLNLALPWRPWSTRERIEPAEAVAQEPVPIIGVLIPARDEAAGIERTLRSVIAQTGIARVVVVDDGSTDGTGELAASVPGVEVVRGAATPPGWSGKLWAQQQGLEALDTPLLLLLDADIELDPGMVAALYDKLSSDELDQVSIMASLPAGSLPEKLLLPAFVYFFKQLYPFAWVNRTDRPFAAAAGGCVLLKREALVRVGGFAAWKNTLIDDCELASRIRAGGGAIWLGLSHGVRSLRRHPDFESLLDTVRRTAYTQLRHSPTLLVAVVLIMLLLFPLPPLALAFGLTTTSVPLIAAGGAGWLLMALGYLPQVRFSRLNPVWALVLPLSGLLFLRATVESAARHHFGAGAGWKGRRYGPGQPNEKH
ncbi:MAG: glycosyltransferase [Wenzhouxiangellaceae bacterium]